MDCLLKVFIPNRKNRLNFRKRIGPFLGIIKNLFLIGDIISDILFLVSNDFDDKTPYFLSILSMLLVPISISFEFYKILFSLDKSIYIKSVSVIFVPILTIFYPILLLFENQFPEELLNVRLISSFEYIVESYPQLCLQIVHNNSNNSWSGLAISSVVLSSISILMGILRIFTAFKNEYVKQFFESNYENIINEIRERKIFDDVITLT